MGHRNQEVTKEEKRDHRKARQEALQEAANFIKACHPKLSTAKVKAAARKLIDQTLSRVNA